MKRVSLKRTGALLVAIAVAAGLAAGALAFWAGSGNGSATTVLADTQSLSFVPGVPTAGLYPGNDVTVATVAHNPNPFFVQVGSIVLGKGGSPFTVDADHSGCDVSVLNFSPQDNGGAGWRIPPRAGSTDGALTIDMPAALSMTNAAANACQGATFEISLEARP